MELADLRVLAIDLFPFRGGRVSPLHSGRRPFPPRPFKQEGRRTFCNFNMSWRNFCFWFGNLFLPLLFSCRYPFYCRTKACGAADPFTIHAASLAEEHSLALSALLRAERDILAEIQEAELHQVQLADYLNALRGQLARLHITRAEHERQLQRWLQADVTPLPPRTLSPSALLPQRTTGPVVCCCCGTVPVPP